MFVVFLAFDFRLNGFDVLFAFDQIQILALAEPQGVLFPRIVVLLPIAQTTVAAETFHTVAATSVEKASIAELFWFLF